MLHLLALFCPRAALAYRPFDSKDAAVVTASQMEIELGPIGYPAEDGKRLLVAPEVGVLLPTVHGEPGAGVSAAVILSRLLRWVTLHLNAAAGLTDRAFSAS